MRTSIIVVTAAAVLAGVPSPAAGEDLRLGVYVPTTPFGDPVKRLEYASRLATQLAASAGKDKGVGRVYARANDFVAAVQRKEIDYAVVGAPYLAASGQSYEVLAIATRGGETSTSWQILVPKDSAVQRVADLKGAIIAAPRIGARDQSFVTRVLLEGEVSAGFFKKIFFVPDSRSAATALTAGRAQAAFVPAGRAPEGTRTLSSLPEIALPLLVALPHAAAATSEAVAAAAVNFTDEGPLNGFKRADNGKVRALARRFSARTKRPPFLASPFKIDLTPLLEGRSLTIERAPAARHFE